MSDLTVPDEFDDWPFDARRFVLAEANTTEDLRDDIDALVGLPADEYESGNAGSFTKDQLAAVVMALGGPRGHDTGGDSA